MLSKISQTQEDKYGIISFVWGTYFSQIQRDRKENTGFHGLWGRENGEFGY
jgi:hypothetical protein